MQNLIKYGGAVVGNEEIKAIIKSIKKSQKTRNWQASDEAKKMEAESSKFLGVKYGILTSSGSCAGLLALSALELPHGSEVIIPAVTFPTIFNIIIQCGLTPVVVDSKIGTYNLDVENVKRAISNKTKAIIAVHTLGNPVDMPKLMKIARKHKIYVIEDNCDGWGSRLNNKPIGSFGDISFTSFHAAHIVSMGVGGGVYTNNSVLAKKVRMYRDWGRQADINQSKNIKWSNLPEDYNPRFIYEKIGYNFQILELQAAMGRVQLRKANKIKNARKKNFNFLYKNLSKFPLIRPQWLPQADVCWFAFPITVNHEIDRGSLLRHLEKNGIETRPMFAGNILRHPAYSNLRLEQFRQSGINHANKILKRSFWISCHPSLTQAQLNYIVKTFNDYFKGYNLDSSDK